MDTDFDVLKYVKKYLMF